MLDIKGIEKLKGVELILPNGNLWRVIRVLSDIDNGYSYRIVLRSGNTETEFCLIRKEYGNDDRWYRLYNNILVYRHLMVNRTQMGSIEGFKKVLVGELIRM